MAEYYENKRDFCLSNGKIVETYLARKNTIYQDSIPKVTYTDFNDNEISEEEYNNFEDKFFRGYEKMRIATAYGGAVSARIFGRAKAASLYRPRACA